MIAVLLLLADVDATELGPKWLETSVAHFRRGNEDEGQKALDELVRLRPDLPIPADYPPLFLRLHKRALQKAKDKARGSIGLPEGANLNGRAFPAGTTRVTDVPAGVHYVSLGKAQKKIVVGAEQVDVSFGKPDAEAILLGNSASFFQDEKPVEKPAEVRRPASGPVAIEQPTYRAIVASPTASTPPPTTRVSSSPPIYKQWWLWTIVGVAVVGASVGIALYATAKVGNVNVSAQWQ